jgi:hypothetical protein
MHIRTVFALVFIVACKGGDEKKAGGGGSSVTVAADDADGDGVTLADGDCDDTDEWIFPGRAEDCDGEDNNCNGVIDEGFSDVDGDDVADCVDEEDCDGVDNDGDGDIDEGFDGDGDGIADCPTEEVCDGLDNDDDGLIDEGFDEDGDGFNSCSDGISVADCNDADDAIHPEAVEVADDLVDNDCDGLVDEGLWASGDLVISEVMLNPNAVRDIDGEWFELTNLSGRLVVLNGLELLSDGDESVFLAHPVPVLLPAGARAVIGNNGDTTTNGGLELDLSYTGMSLSNEVDHLRVRADGVLIDQVNWDDGATMPDPSGYSLSLDPDHVGAHLNDEPEVWCFAGGPWAPGSDWGSPGLPNHPCPQFDHDGDGWRGEDGDCDDENPDVYPGAPEISVGVDNDCDGIAAARPVAAADYDLSASSLMVGATVYLDGSGSFDPDGSGLTFSWALDDVPVGSTAWLNSSTSSLADFVPDIEGTYGVSLTVNDGVLSSVPSRITFEIEAPEL